MIVLSSLTEAKIRKLKPHELTECVAQLFGWRWYSYIGPAADRRLGNDKLCKNFMPPDVNVDAWQERYPEFCESSGDEPQGYDYMRPSPPSYASRIDEAFDAASDLLVSFSLEREESGKFAFWKSEGDYLRLLSNGKNPAEVVCRGILIYWMRSIATSL